MWKQCQKKFLQEIMVADEEDELYEPQKEAALLKSIQVWYAAKTSREVSEFDDCDSHICNVVKQYIEEVVNQ